MKIIRCLEIYQLVLLEVNVRINVIFFNGVNYFKLIYYYLSFFYIYRIVIIFKVSGI